MATRSFKSISPQELEVAIASAISALTGTPTEVSTEQWGVAEFESISFIGKDNYELQLSLSVGKSYAHDRIARASLKDDLDPTDDSVPF